MSRTAIWGSGLGASIASVLASACCIGPIILGTLGAGSAGFASALAPFRPYLLTVTAGLLGFAFWRVYRRPPAEECCDPDPSSGRPGGVQKRFLWAVTVIVALSAFFPALQAQFLQSGDSTPLEPAAADIVLEITGMTCSSCEHHIQAELEHVPWVEGIQVSYERGEARLSTTASPGDPQDLLQAVERAGYSATVKQDVPPHAIKP